ncbi:MAG: M20/M25/M40 family metallo-hydrolase [Flavobacteriaceae bacterium]|nr:M20/M25/M40 family metallo-hydrolase [Flavobacteriaceae bacterium]MDZ4149417.1 M20/M25/M40 family metallo-hydrolase [Flavobacteriaceae bacterium]
MKNQLFFTTVICLLFNFTQAQQTEFKSDSIFLDKIFNTSLTNGMSYEWLSYMTNKIGSRLSGSLGAERAVEWGKNTMQELKFDKVWLQEVMVPKWVRGTSEFAYIDSGGGTTNVVPIAALGGSVSTPPDGIKARVVEVQNFEELAKIGKDSIEGKIVFFNRPMQAEFIETFRAYGGAVNQRTQGAAEAAKYGAVGVIVRSMTLSVSDDPHTGTMSYGDLALNKRIPAAAISTKGAELLSGMLKLNPQIRFYFKQNSKNLGDVLSYNVVGEIRGSQYPNEIIVVGGHLDSWDLGDGAHDDGAGIVQSIEVLRLFKILGYKPKRTIRVVLFMNEENGLRGANKYAEVAKQKGENHVFGLESDAGGFTPRGFSFAATDSQFERISTWKSLFTPYLTDSFTKGGGGADIGPLKTDKNILAGLRPDSQRYFDIHHTASDVIGSVNKRELELGAAAMASLIYLIDQYGIN